MDRRLSHGRARHATLRAIVLTGLSYWLLRELSWLRRWRAYWRSLADTMRARTLTTNDSVPLSLDAFSSFSPDLLRTVIGNLLWGQKLRRSESFAASLHRGLSYLVNRRHPSSVALAHTQPHIERVQSTVDDILETDSELPLVASAHDEPSAFAEGPACWPLPWIACTAAQALRPLASATSLPRSAEGAPAWHSSTEDAGVTILWREPTCDATCDAMCDAPPPITSHDEQCAEATPWLLLHGIGGVDRRCVEGLIARCDALTGRLLILPVHPNWETYSTVPQSHTTGEDADGLDTPAHFVTTRRFVRAIGAALARRRIDAVHVIAWSMGSCFATMLHEEFPRLRIHLAIYIDPAAALPLASSAWRWLLEPRLGVSTRAFYQRARRLGIGAWLVRAATSAGQQALPTDADHATDAAETHLSAGSSGSHRGWAIEAALDAISAVVLAIGCRLDHLRVAPELHPCAHGCDVDAHVLNRRSTLLLLDRQDNFLCPPDHVDYLSTVCPLATVRWREGWHCGWMYDRMCLDAGEGLAAQIDAFVEQRARDQHLQGIRAIVLENGETVEIS